MKNIIKVKGQDELKRVYEIRDLKNKGSRVNIFAVNTFGQKEEDKKLEVNWSAQGSQTPKEAIRYAKMIIMASEYAEKYNAKLGK